MIWSTLSYTEAKETYATLHLWTQVVGKVKLAKLPWINHSWHVTLFVTPTGLTTGDISDKNGHFQIDFDFIQHRLLITTDKGEARSIDLKQMVVAEFYDRLMKILDELAIEVTIRTIPNELMDVIPFEKDYTHQTYDPQHARDLHMALIASEEVLTLFRSEFVGKCSPVHFFWGSFDLAVSRFSGRKAPRHPGGIPNLPDWVAQEAYSHEVYSCGFWPGNEMVPYAAFYAYIYPEPENFKGAPIHPSQAFYHSELMEYILPYETVQKSDNPENTLLQFLHSTYDAAASLATWDRQALEKSVIRQI